MKQLFSLRTLLILGGLALVGSIAWSMWVDTLQPLYRAGETAALLRNLLGLPLILLGFVVMCWGFVAFLRDFMKLSDAPEWQTASASRDNRKLAADERQVAQRTAQSLAVKHLAPGFLMVFGGIGMIVLGGIIRNWH